MLFVLLVMTLLFFVLIFIPYVLALSSSLLLSIWSSPLLPLIRSMSSANHRLHMGLPPVEIDVWWPLSVSCMIFCWNSWTGWVRVGFPDRHLLLSWKTSVADCSRGPHCWISHIVPERLEPDLSLCWRFWGPATGLYVRLCQMPSWRLWSCGIDHTGVIGASLWWLYHWRSVLLCSGQV